MTKRKRKKRKALPPGKTAPTYVRSTRSCGNVPGINRPDAKHTRKANRRARAAGFDNAVGFAAYLIRMAEQFQRFSRGMFGGFRGGR